MSSVDLNTLSFQLSAAELVVEGSLTLTYGASLKSADFSSELLDYTKSKESRAF
jgi:hypothetical protein